MLKSPLRSFTSSSISVWAAEGCICLGETRPSDQVKRRDAKTLPFFCSVLILLCWVLLRPGWLTVGPNLTNTNFNPETYASHFASPDSYLSGCTEEIERLRPKSPVKLKSDRGGGAPRGGRGGPNAGRGGDRGRERNRPNFRGDRGGFRGRGGLHRGFQPR